MSNAVIVNFAAGETSPKSRGRFDTPWYSASCQKLLNFIPDVTGPAVFRSGFKLKGRTNNNDKARLFFFRTVQGGDYVLEFTPLSLQIYKSGSILTSQRAVVTGITQGSPGVITVDDIDDLIVDDEVIITGDLVGMDDLKDQRINIKSINGNTFPVSDLVLGLSQSTTNFRAYVSGGTVERIKKITTPYAAKDLADLNFAYNEGVGYIVHFAHQPRKFTIDSADDFSLATYARTNDPFNASSALTVLDIFLSGTADSRGGPSVGVPSGKTYVIFTGGTSVLPDVLYAFADVVGTTQINGSSFFLEIDATASAALGKPTAFIKTAAGADVDSSAWGSYVSGGTATPPIDNPITVAFYENRLVFGGTNQRQTILFLSRAPNTTTGNSRFDDFTGGSNADDAAFFSMAAVNGPAGAIAWMRGTAKYLFVGTYGGPFRISGGGLDEPITPTSINIRQFDIFGCEATPAVGGSRIFFLQRGGTTLRSTRLDAITDEYESQDLGLNAEQIAFSRLQRLALQVGRPDIIWATRANGTLAGLTFQSNENVTGWHLHKAGGTDVKILDIITVPRTDKNDELWIVVERLVTGEVRRTIETLTDPVEFPDFIDFFTGKDNKAADFVSFQNATYRKQEGYVYVDAAGTFNGSSRGIVPAAGLTPSATTGTGINFTASTGAIFRAADVGDELWHKPDPVTGIGGGRATIVSITSPTVVVADIIVDFNSTDLIPTGDWFFAVKIIFGLWHLEGEVVAVQTDGAVASDGRGVSADYTVFTVASGKITLDEFAAVVHIGLPYEGILKTQNLEIGGKSGPAQDKPRNIVKMFIKFLNTLGASFGTGLYRQAQILHRTGVSIGSRPQTVFSGSRELPHFDNWDKEKAVVITQRLPLPCTVQYINVDFETADE